MACSYLIYVDPGHPQQQLPAWVSTHAGREQELAEA
jgi:hypothetical protein